MITKRAFRISPPLFFFFLPFKTRLQGIKIRKIALWMSASGRAMGEIWWLRPGDESSVKKNVWLKNISLLYLPKSLLSANSCNVLDCDSWTISANKKKIKKELRWHINTPFASYKLSFNCLWVCICSWTVQKCGHMHTKHIEAAVRKIKWTTRYHHYG